MKHAERIQALVSHPEVLATANLPRSYPTDGAVEWIQGLGQRRGPGAEYAFAILNEGGDLVGTCGFIHPAGGARTAEIGYWIGRPFWGRGYATEALRLLLDFIFQNRRTCLVRARTLPENPASCRVLEKVGFALARELPIDDVKRSRGHAVRYYVLRRTERKGRTA
jgi:RimJ/RimL family protein N-acetyltransferase